MGLDGICLDQVKQKYFMVFCQLCSQFVGSGFQFPSSIFVEKRPYFPCSSLLLVKDHLEDPLRATCDCECVGGYS